MGKFIRDSVHHTVYVVEYFVVPKAQNSESWCYEPSVTALVVGDVASMLPTIDLHDESLREADEINDICSKRLLTTKLTTK